MLFKHSREFDHFKDAQCVQHRPINHLNPVRTEHARAVKFPLCNTYEDNAYTARLKASNRLAKEVFIDKVLYLYIWNANTTETQQPQ